jgi:hypothetical protein
MQNSSQNNESILVGGHSIRRNMIADVKEFKKYYTLLLFSALCAILSSALLAWFVISKNIYISMLNIFLAFCVILSSIFVVWAWFKPWCVKLLYLDGRWFILECLSRNDAISVKKRLLSLKLD